MIRHFKTNLRCEGCLTVIRPVLDKDSAVKRWEVDLASPDKTLTIEGESVDRDHVDRLLKQVGYQTTGETERPATVAVPSVGEEAKQSYFPLILIVAYLIGIVGLVEFAAGGFEWTRAMANFMAGFFLAFSFFKLLSLSQFADSYAMYDIVAKRFRPYALAYPFIELALGVAYLTRFQPIATNVVTLVIMAVSSVGVAQSVLAKRKIRCACLGAVFNLPMTFVTLFEDLLMAGMAAAMLLTGH